MAVPTVKLQVKFHCVFNDAQTSHSGLAGGFLWNDLQRLFRKRVDFYCMCSVCMRVFFQPFEYQYCRRFMCTVLFVHTEAEGNRQ